MTSCSQWKNCTSFLCSKEKRQGFRLWDSHPPGPAPCNVSSMFLPKNILRRNGIIDVFLRNNTGAFKSKVENAQESIALRLTEIKHGSRRLFFQIRFEIRGLFDGARKANRKVQPITEPENYGGGQPSHQNQMLTAMKPLPSKVNAIWWLSLRARRARAMFCFRCGSIVTVDGRCTVEAGHGSRLLGSGRGLLNGANFRG